MLNLSVFAVPNLVIFTRRVGELLNHPIGHIGLNSFVSFFWGGFLVILHKLSDS